ncbi:CrcB family protein [Croceicoccus sp. F390]|uniref:Fluoride-specific ion channel FluC n=1 Tax=Croceicoccus esteveae TaxID=3075597 RepID=A0ABU2ZDH0_9SPHN|nr:CrcB family protein [Croceicoccus sp. F390]MDT0574646.1 CrcB family protein [Croceicoccus sp. F390]
MNQPSSLVAPLLVATGGGAGAVLRYAVGRLVAHRFAIPAEAFPIATAFVNIVGSLLMGVLVGWQANGGSASGTEAQAWRLLVGMGLLGGFTTFSSFSLDLVVMWQRGAIGAALGYAALSLGGGVAGLLTGLYVMRGTG